MRTTLDLDDDVLQAAKEIASVRGQSAGKVVSDLIRKALRATSSHGAPVRNGVPLFTPRPGAPPLTMAMVNRLRDE